MFKIYLNDECFYDDRMEQRSITGLKLTLEENKAGSLEFTIYPDHPYYSAFEKITSTILVKQNDVIIFRGRVLDSEESFYKDRKITCEGEYAFFNDGIFYPLGQDGGEDEYGEEQITPFTPIEIFTQIITDYNSQVSEDRRFLIGNISITGSTEEIGYANMEFIKSIEALDDLIDRCGGHFIFRHEDEGVYIDWTEDYESINQDVSFGINLLDLTQTIQGDKVVTAILPHGDTREDTNWPCNISTLQIPTTTLHRQMGVVPDSESRNEQFGDYGIYLVNIPLYEKYGLIIEERSYDGYPDDWKDQLIADVDNLTGLSNSIEITAVDMSCLNDVDFFQIGKKVDVISDKHGIKDSYNITKLELNLQNPSSNKFTLGKVIPNFVEQIVNDNKTKPVDGKSIKITGYEFAYAISESGTEKPDDESFSTTYSPQQGKWLWTRVTTKFNDGTETKCYYPSYQGMDAKQFKIKADSTVVIRNDRRTDAQTIIFTADISGYPNAVPLWYIDGEKVGEGGSYSRNIPYKKAEAFSVNLYDGTVLKDTLNLTVIDKTGGALYLGACENSVPTQTSEGTDLIKGDYFLCTKSFAEFLAGNPYVYNGASWESAELSGNVSVNEYADIMSKCLEDALNTDTVENTKYSSWFKKLAANIVFTNMFISRNLHIVTNNFEFQVSTIDDDGNKLEYPIWEVKYNNNIIFKIDTSNGTISAQNADFINSSISGTAIITNGQFKGFFDCESIKAQPDESSVYKTVIFYASQGIKQVRNLAIQLGYNPPQTSNGVKTRCRLSGNSNVAFFKLELSYDSYTFGSYSEDRIIFYDIDGKEIKLANLGIGYSGDTTHGYLFTSNSYNFGDNFSGCYFTQDVTLEVLQGGNRLVVNIPGIEGQGVTSDEIDSYETGRLYIDSSRYLRVKI